MAKRTKDPLDDVKVDPNLEGLDPFDNLDSAFDFDLEMDEIDGKSREPITDQKTFLGKLKAKSAIIATGMAKGMKQTIKYSLPNTESLASQALNVASDVSMMRDDFTRELEPSLNTFKSASRRLAGRMKDRGAIPESLYDKIARYTKTDDGYSAPSKSENERYVVSEALKGVFEQEREERKLDRRARQVETFIDRRTESIRASQLVGVLGDIRLQTLHTSQFLSGTYTGYLRESLRLQFEQNFIAKDSLEILRLMAQVTENKLEALVHNTGLPEIQKERNSETFKALTRNKLLGGFSEYAANFGKKVIGNVKSSILDPVVSGVGMGADMLSGMNDLAEMEDDERAFTGAKPKSLKQRALEVALGGAAGLVGAGAAGKVMKKIDPHTQGIEDFAATGVDRALIALDRLATEGVGESGPLASGGWLQMLLQDIIPGIDRGSGKVQNLYQSKPTDHATFDVAVHTSIVEIMPGYLAEIAKQVTQFNTGMPGEEKVFDPQTRDFVPVSRYQAELKDRVFGTMSMRTGLMANMLNDLKTPYLGKGSVYKQEQKAVTFNELSDQLAKFVYNMAQQKKFRPDWPDEVRILANNGGDFKAVSNDTRELFKGIDNVTEVASIITEAIFKEDGTKDIDAQRKYEKSVFEFIHYGLDLHRAKMDKLAAYGHTRHLKGILSGTATGSLVANKDAVRDTMTTVDKQVLKRDDAYSWAIDQYREMEGKKKQVSGILKFVVDPKYRRQAIKTTAIKVKDKLIKLLVPLLEMLHIPTGWLTQFLSKPREDITPYDEETLTALDEAGINLRAYKAALDEELAIAALGKRKGYKEFKRSKRSSRQKIEDTLKSATDTVQSRAKDLITSSGKLTDNETTDAIKAKAEELLTQAKSSKIGTQIADLHAKFTDGSLTTVGMAGASQLKAKVEELTKQVGAQAGTIDNLKAKAKTEIEKITGGAPTVAPSADEMIAGDDLSERIQSAFDNITPDASGKGSNLFKSSYEKWTKHLADISDSVGKASKDLIDRAKRIKIPGIKASGETTEDPRQFLTLGDDYKSLLEQQIDLLQIIADNTANMGVTGSPSGDYKRKSEGRGFFRRLARTATSLVLSPVNAGLGTAEGLFDSFRSFIDVYRSDDLNTPLIHRNQFKDPGVMFENKKRLKSAFDIDQPVWLLTDSSDRSTWVQLVTEDDLKAGLTDSEGRSLSRVSTIIGKTAKRAGRLGGRIIGGALTGYGTALGFMAKQAWNVAGGALGAANRLVRPFPDIYLANQDRTAHPYPHVYGKTIELYGQFAPKKGGGRPIKVTSCWDIDRPVIHAQTGEFLITADDIKAGLVDRNGKSLLTNPSAIKSILSGLFDTISGVTSLGTGTIGWAFAKVHSVVRSALFAKEPYQDVYQRGNISESGLLVTGRDIRDKKIRFADTGAILESCYDIDAPLQNEEGSIIVTREHIKRGLVNRSGEALNRVTKHGLAGGLLRAIPGLGIKAVKGVFNTAGRVLGKVFGRAGEEPAGILGGLQTVLGGLFKDVFGDPKERVTRSSIKELVTDRLERIIEILDGRLAKRVKGDTDDDGYQEGSYQDKQKDKERKQEAKDKLQDRKNKKFSIGGALGGLGQSGQQAPGKDKDDSGGWLDTLGAWMPESWKNKATGWLGKAGGMLGKGVGRMGGLATTGLTALANTGVGTAVAGGMSTAATAIGTGAATAGTAIAGLGTAAGSALAASIVSNPIGWAVGGVLVVGAGGYMLYDWLTSKNQVEKDLLKLRCDLYGVDPISTESAIDDLEQLTMDIFAGKHVPIDDATAEQYAKKFKCFDKKNIQGSVGYWLTWYKQRFVPVFNIFLTTLNRLKIKYSNLSSVNEDQFKSIQLAMNKFAKAKVSEIEALVPTLQAFNAVEDKKNRKSNEEKPKNPEVEKEIAEKEAKTKTNTKKYQTDAEATREAYRDAEEKRQAKNQADKDKAPTTDPQAQKASNDIGKPGAKAGAATAGVLALVRTPTKQAAETLAKSTTKPSEPLPGNRADKVATIMGMSSRGREAIRGGGAMTLPPSALTMTKTKDEAVAAAQAQAKTQTPTGVESGQPSGDTSDGTRLGDHFKKFESGKQGSNAVGFDKVGGTSYGKYQLASNVGGMQEFLKFAASQGPNGAEVASRMNAAGPLNTGTTKGAAVDTWKQLAQEGKLGDLEHQFIKQKFYDVALKKLNPEVRKMVEGNRALQESLWSTSVQNSGIGGAKTFNKVYQPGMSSEDFIKALYAKRKTQFGSSTPQIQASVAKRMDKEMAEALSLSQKNAPQEAAQQAPSPTKQAANELAAASPPSTTPSTPTSPVTTNSETVTAPPSTAPSGDTKSFYDPKNPKSATDQAGDAVVQRNIDKARAAGDTAAVEKWERFKDLKQKGTPTAEASKPAEATPVDAAKEQKSFYDPKGPKSVHQQAQDAIIQRNIDQAREKGDTAAVEKWERFRAIKQGSTPSTTSAAATSDTKKDNFYDPKNPKSVTNQAADAVVQRNIDKAKEEGDSAKAKKWERFKTLKQAAPTNPQTNDPFSATPSTTSTPSSAPGQPTAPGSTPGAPGGEVASPEEGLSKIKTQPGVDVAGLTPAMKKALGGANAEFMAKFGKPMTVTSGKRSMEKQAELYSKLGPSQAAKPSPNAPHIRGVAADVSTQDANKADSAGILAKFGLARPLWPSGKGSVKPEPWHLQVAGAPSDPADMKEGSAKEPTQQSLENKKPVADPGIGGSSTDVAAADMSNKLGSGSEAGVPGSGEGGSGGLSETTTPPSTGPSETTSGSTVPSLASAHGAKAADQTTATGTAGMFSANESAASGESPTTTPKLPFNPNTPSPSQIARQMAGLIPGMANLGKSGISNIPGMANLVGMLTDNPLVGSPTAPNAPSPVAGAKDASAQYFEQMISILTNMDKSLGTVSGWSLDTKMDGLSQSMASQQTAANVNPQGPAATTTPAVTEGTPAGPGANAPEPAKIAPNQPWSAGRAVVPVHTQKTSNRTV